MKSIYKFTVVLAASFIFTSVSAQISVDLSATKDNTLYQDASGSQSNGAGAHFFVGKTNQSLVRRGLLAFDVAGIIPAGATISSVSLTLNMSRTAAGSATVSLNRVLSDWGEGTSNASSQEGQGAPSRSGDATWIHTFFNTNQWTSAGGDFFSTASASQTVGVTGSYTWGSTSQMVADVQNWLDNPSNNFGWIVVGNETGTKTTKRFDSKENSTASNRPVLNITYSTATLVDKENNGTPAQFVLSQNYPNPFNPETEINFSIPVSEFISLEIFNTLGQHVRTLVSEQLNAGNHSALWDGRNKLGLTVDSGVYFYRLNTALFQKTKQMILIK